MQVGELPTEPGPGQRVYRVRWSIPPHPLRTTFVGASSADQAWRLVVSLEPRGRVHNVRLAPER